jgi:hypothetical protein
MGAYCILQAVEGIVHSEDSDVHMDSPTTIISDLVNELGPGFSQVLIDGIANSLYAFAVSSLLLLTRLRGQELI